MLIDWFTVGAQIINFLVLAALLKYFLYGRITRAMREREERIAARLSEAEGREQAAKRELSAYQHKRQELDREREQILTRAREEAVAEKKKLMQAAREEVEQVKSRWYEAIQREKAAFLVDLRQRAGRHLYAVARRALADLADADLEERISRSFRQRLATLAEDQQQVLREALSADLGAVITSAFPLGPEVRAEIARILQGYYGDGVKLDYQLSPEVISGIELKVRGYKVAWSLNEYLETLEEDLEGALEEKV